LLAHLMEPDMSAKLTERILEFQDNQYDKFSKTFTTYMTFSIMKGFVYDTQLEGFVYDSQHK